jgi:hypothetical protein
MRSLTWAAGARRCTGKRDSDRQAERQPDPLRAAHPLPSSTCASKTVTPEYSDVSTTTMTNRPARVASTYQMLAGPGVA